MMDLQYIFTSPIGLYCTMVQAVLVLCLACYENYPSGASFGARSYTVNKNHRNGLNYIKII